METNRNRISQLRNELDRIGNEIREAGREADLKELAAKVQREEIEIPHYIPEVFQHDPERDEHLCEYYLSLFAEFEAIKHEEWNSRQKGPERHKEWLKSEFRATEKYAEATKSFLRSVAEKIAVSGVTAGLIWLGKMIIDNWPFGYGYTTTPIQEQETAGRSPKESAHDA